MDSFFAWICETLASILVWIEAHSGLSSWLQAFGNFFAVGVAIYVPYRLQKMSIKFEYDRVAYGEGTRLNAIVAICCQIQAIITLIETEGNTKGYHMSDLDMSYFDVSLDQLKNLPLFEIPDRRVILRVSTLPIAIKKMQHAWNEFSGNLSLGGMQTSTEAFVANKDILKNLTNDAIATCTAKLKTL